MRSTKYHPNWLRGVHLFGFDDDSNDGNDDGNDDGDDGADGNDEEEEEDSDDKDDKGGSGADTAGLKSALRKERKARKAAERERNALKKANESKDEKDQTDLDSAKAERDAEKQRSERLAAQFAKTEVNRVIEREAGKLGFIDPEDAVAMVERDDIEFDQDEDDPATVQVDRDSVKEALNDLKKLKPHLVVADGDEDRSGGKFNGRKKQPKKKTDAELAEEEAANYPAMRNRTNS